MHSDIYHLQDDVTSFKNRFEEFVKDIEKKNNITHAQGRIIILNQEIEKNLDCMKRQENTCWVYCKQLIPVLLVSKQLLMLQKI